MGYSRQFGMLLVVAFLVVGCGKGTTNSVDTPDKKIIPLQSKSAGKFSIARMWGALDKASASFFFLLTNSGGREITNITLSTPSSRFQVTPQVSARFRRALPPRYWPLSD